MKLTFLGTAGLVPPGMGLKVTGIRGMNSMLIDDDYLLEVGDGALRNLIAHGTNLNAVKRVLVSHLHSDHFIGIVHVLHNMVAVHSRTEPLEIIGPLGIAKSTRGLMDLCGLHTAADDEKRGYELRFKELSESEHFDDIQTTRGEHPVETHAYRIRRNNRVLFYNGESIFTDEVLNLAQGADLFVSTVSVPRTHSYHISPEALGKAATKAGVKRVATVHWPPDFEEKHDEFKGLIAKHFSGEIIIPDDFTTIEV
jgi:ribonuclease BN (tRNA processing enzyme)